MSGYRDLINDIQKSKRELKDSRDAEERKSLQDKIDKLEKEKQRFAANNNAPPTTNPRNVDGAQTPTILPQGATTTQRTYANSPRTTNDESAAPESTPTTNVKPAAPAATKSASAATATTPKTKGAGPANSTTTAEGTTGANQSTTTNTPVITEFPVQSQSDISLSTILEKDINILNEGKPFAIYENIKDESGKNIKISLEFEPIVKIDPVTKIKTIKFRPRLTQSNERLYNKMRKYKGNNDLLVSAKLSDGMKLN
jgi:hypothetical protein